MCVSITLRTGNRLNLERLSTNNCGWLYQDSNHLSRCQYNPSIPRFSWIPLFFIPHFSLHHLHRPNWSRYTLSHTLQSRFLVVCIRTAAMPIDNEDESSARSLAPDHRSTSESPPLSSMNLVSRPDLDFIQIMEGSPPPESSDNDQTDEESNGGRRRRRRW